MWGFLRTQGYASGERGRDFPTAGPLRLEGWSFIWN